jgi:RHS repeat-associated protein
MMRFHQLDGLGNVIGTFQSGSLSQSVSYDSWGVPSLQGNADNRLLWKGLMWEGDIVSLYYMRNRWYDPELGRFLSEDPIGEKGHNLYSFANNDPVEGSDPTGLCTADPSLWIDFVLRSPGQGKYTLTCHDLPPVIITAASPTVFYRPGNPYSPSQVDYIGLTAVHIGGAGPTLGFGVYHEADGSGGLYLKVGMGFGFAQGVGIEGGSVQSADQFFGTSVSGCVSYAALGECVQVGPHGSTGGSTSATRSMRGIRAGMYAEVSRTFGLGNPLRSALESRFVFEGSQFLRWPYGFPR